MKIHFLVPLAPIPSCESKYCGKMSLLGAGGDLADGKTLESCGGLRSDYLLDRGYLVRFFFVLLGIFLFC